MALLEARLEHALTPMRELNASVERFLKMAPVVISCGVL